MLGENTDSKISDIPCSNIFANISSRARDIKKNTNGATPNKKASTGSRNQHQNEKETDCMGEHIYQ